VGVDTLVLTILAAANRDPPVYPDGHRFDITRTGGPEHFAFSSGIHYCLGAQLAHIEGEVAFRALSERLPRIRPAGIPQQRPSASIRGFPGVAAGGVTVSAGRGHPRATCWYGW